MRINWGKGSSDKVAAVYDKVDPRLTWFEKVGLASTDWLMTCYVRRIALAASAQGVPTFLYHFLHPNGPGADPTNAKQPTPAYPACVDGRAVCHAGDNMYTMGSVDRIPAANMTLFERNLSDLIMMTTSRLAAHARGSAAEIAAAVRPLVPYDGGARRSLAWGGTYAAETAAEQLSSVVTGWRSEVCAKRSVPPCQRG